MNIADETVLVTGGAGHVGSTLAARLQDRCSVVVADDLSNGRREWVPEGVEFRQLDLSRPGDAQAAMEDVDLVFHLAVAEKDVAVAASEQFTANVELTQTVLEAAIDADVTGIAFTSSSTVYGEDVPLPTPETYGPLAPISAYGAAKAAEEALLSTARERADLDIWIARLGNVVGPVFDGSVTPDFVEKLHESPAELEILGDGHQQKSYIHVEDVARALEVIVTHGDPDFGVYNVATPEAISVRRVAEIVSDVMGLDPTFAYTGGDRGWSGDVPRMQLAIDRLVELGWEPAYDCEAAVSTAATALAAQLD